MFPWSAVLSVAPKVSGQRSTEELVTNTLMLELGALVKRAERIRQERAMQVRRRSSAVDYTWLADSSPKLAFEISPREVLELQNLCTKIPPSQCGPIILKFRKLVAEFEPDVHEVPSLFRSLLRDCLDEEEERDLSGAEMQARASRWSTQRSRSLSFVSFRSRFLFNPFKGVALGGSRNNLQEGAMWMDEEVEGDPNLSVPAGRRGRSRSMPDITPLEDRS
ncbi:RD3 domain-containing protein [Brienomyrus brachyistius]|uniref:RD3 domain-containing protein n=1 Tax=Brienomyrus brachyistius TaxID=42636 RepID=UPI0020B41474|nr:RD3 domain-containing protein [Brienomyrus brachyistius]